MQFPLQTRWINKRKRVTRKEEDKNERHLGKLMKKSPKVKGVL